MRWTGEWSLNYQHQGILILSQRMPRHDNAAVIEALLSTHPNLENQLLGYDISTNTWGAYDITLRGYRRFR